MNAPRSDWPFGGRVPNWEELTQQPLKAGLFGAETEVREAWSDFCDELGPEPEQILHQIAFLVLKPDAIKRRCATAVINFGIQHGFVPIATSRFVLSRNISHVMWKYQWNCATVDRMRLTTLINVQTPSLMIVFRDRNPIAKLPAAVRLWELKGSSDEKFRKPHHLRTLLNMKNRVISFVHSSDEPADIFREYAILFDRQARTALLKEIAANFLSDRTHDALTAASALESLNAYHSVDVEEVITRISGLADTGPVLELFRDRKIAQRRELFQVSNAFTQSSELDDVWDFILVASELIRYEVPGIHPTLDANDIQTVRAAWTGTGL